MEAVEGEAERSEEGEAASLGFARLRSASLGFARSSGRIFLAPLGLNGLGARILPKVGTGRGRSLDQGTNNNEQRSEFSGVSRGS